MEKQSLNNNTNTMPYKEEEHYLGKTAGIISVGNVDLKTGFVTKLACLCEARYKTANRVYGCYRGYTIRCLEASSKSNGHARRKKDLCFFGFFLTY